MSWNLYLDDLRMPPDGWTLCRSVAEAQKKFTELGKPYYASLDHDLGIHYCRVCAFSDGEEPCLDDYGDPRCGCTCHVELPTGLDMVKWMHETGNWPTIKPTIHSANPIGSVRMRNYINDFGPY
jgi:hypothetical protein